MAIGRVIQVSMAGTACFVVASCGGASQPSGSVGPYGPKSSPVALSKCMRANGVANFPDPSAGPGGGVGFNGLFVEGDGGLVVDGINFAGPAFNKAKRACSGYLPPSGPPPQLSASQRAKMVSFARCMRAHGVPNFPDPTFGSGPGKALPAPEVAPSSPAFRHAVQTCGSGRLAVRIAG